MTEVKDAAKRRSVSKGQLTRILKTVEEAINNETLSRTIIGWMSEARLRWQQVQERHEDYVIVKDGDIEEMDDEQWIHQESQRFRCIEEKVDCYLEQLDRRISEGEEIKRMEETKADEDRKQREKINRQEMEKQKLLKEIRLRRKNERQKFDRIKKEIERDVVLEDNIEQMVKLTKDNLNVLLESKRSCEQLQQSYEIHGGDMTEEEEINWIERLYDDYYSVSRVAKLFIGKDVKEANVGRSNMKLEKLKFEEFDGSLRKYPKFKKDFNKIIRPLYSKEEAAFALRSYLSETVKLEVEYVGDNYEMIWERLDTKYGNESKLIDLIMQDIKCLKISKEDYGQESLKLISIVERAHRDLTVIGREREISNATIVSLLEEKLPKKIEDDWLEIVTGERAKDIDRDKFPALLQLLLKHKSMIEYKSSAIRKSSSSKGTVHLVEEENMHGTVFMNAMDTKNGRCWLHPEDTSHPIWRCQDLLAMSAKDRMEMVREKRACFKCLSLGHAARFCRRLFKCRINNCGKPHHDLLHEAYLPGITLHNKTSENCNVLLQIQNISCKRGDGRIDDINVLWDSGSTLSFITFKKAQSMKLRSKERVNMRITKVGGIAEGISTTTFQLTMLDKLNEEVAVTVFGMDKISNNIATIEVEKVKYFFPKVKLKDYNRPLNGEVECLVGFEMAEYHPVKKQSVGNLLLLENNFGLIIGGSHSDITRTTNKVIKEALICHINVRVEDFYSIEKLGVEVFPKCGSCRCGRCHPGGRCMSLKDEREYKMIEEGLNYSEDEKRFVARYPFLKDPRHLPNNRNAVFGMLRSTERRLMRNPLNAKMYQTQIEDMIERKVCKKLEESEIENYTGPMFYLAHHAVIKRESKSTPCRIVFNSSAKFKGNSLNDILAKGPDMLNNLLGVLLRFREERVVIFGDISKMYHSIGVTEFDQMLHCFLWRDFRIEEKPDTYAITVVNFGDRPSATIALCALQKAAERGREEYPEASKMISENSYMDDIVDSVPTVDLANKLTKNADSILKNAGFKVKEWLVSSYDADVQIKEASCEKILGICWNKDDDTISCPKRGNASQVEEEVPVTKRGILRQINSIYDPTGSVSPVTLKAKLFMRKLWTEYKYSKWDDTLPMEVIEEWRQIKRELQEIQNVKFRRCTKPVNTVGDPELILFSDGSKESYGAVAYARWEKNNGTFESCFLASKNRVAPVKTIDIVRLELCGAVLSKRLRMFVVEMMRYKFKAVYHFVDSQIVKAMISKSSYGFNTFVANRIGEIQEKTDAKEWLWVPGKLNISDWLTRGKHPHDLGPDSIWQKGPGFLERKQEEWPVSKDWSVENLPETIKSFVGILRNGIEDEDEEDSLEVRIDITRFSKLQLLYNITARILGLYRRFRKNNGGLDDNNQRNIVMSSQDLKEAEGFWVKVAQAGLKTRIEKGELKKLCPRYENGVIVVGGRCVRWNEATWNKQEFILLPYDHCLSRLIALNEHKKSGHLGKSATIAKVRARYWIIRIDRIVGRIVNRCIGCKKRRAKPCQQIMSDLPVERLKPSPPFTNVGVDYFGPFALKGEVQKRVRGKGYGVIFTCFITRAVYVDVAQNYSTDGFLQVLRRFASIRGWPKLFYSDNGSNLVGASKELKEVITSFKKEELIRFSIEHGTEWRFTPAEAPWMNGVTESMVKSVKRSLEAVIGSHVMEFSVMQTILFEVAQMINSRPIGRHPTDPEDGSYLCPNDLLLGRSSTRIPQGPFNEKVSSSRRYEFLQNLAKMFWVKWTRDYFPSLIIRSKWHVEKRNVLVDDVVLIKDKEAKRGYWKTGIVKEAIISGDGRIRKAVVVYKNVSQDEPIGQYQGSRFVEVQRPVHNLIVLHSPREEELEIANSH